MRTDFTEAFGQASKSFRAVLTVALRRHGMHLGQNFVLSTLSERDGQTPGEIAEMLNVTTPTIVKMATRMSASGLLVRRRDETDNRLVRLYLTDAGRALWGPVQREIADVEERLTEGFSDRERATFVKLMNRFAANAWALLDEWHEEPPE